MFLSRIAPVCGLLFSWLCLIGAFGGCTGPVSDPVAAAFRKKWIASHTGTAAPFEGIASAADRNQFIDEFLVIKDLQFNNYVTALRRGSSYGELGADSARLTLDGLAAVTGTSAAKSGLAAASAGITGFTGAVKKDVLFDQALPVFIDKMVGLRASKRADILSKKKLSLGDYTASEAYADVEEYGSMGTFDSAIRALNVETGQSTGQSKAASAEANGDTVTAQTLRGRYVGPIESKTVRVNVEPMPAKPVRVSVNKLHADTNKMSAPARDALLEVAASHAELKAQMDRMPRGTDDAKNYIFNLEEDAARRNDEEALKIWRQITPVHPVAEPTATPPTTPPPVR